MKFKFAISALALLASATVFAAAQQATITTAKGKVVNVTTSDDGTVTLVVDGVTLSPAEATQFLASEGVVVSVSPTGTIMGVRGATVTAAPVAARVQAPAARAVAPAAVAAPATTVEMPAIQSMGATVSVVTQTAAAVVAPSVPTQQNVNVEINRAEVGLSSGVSK